MRRPGERPGNDGAAAVEFALLLPLLVLILGGIIDFGFAFNAQISLTHAAREGVRVAAIGTGDPEATATDAFLAPATSGFTVTVTDCAGAATQAVVQTQATYDYFILSILSLGPTDLTSEAVMRCNG